MYADRLRDLGEQDYQRLLALLTKQALEEAARIATMYEQRANPDDYTELQAIIDDAQRVVWRIQDQPCT